MFTAKNKELKSGYSKKQRTGIWLQQKTKSWNLFTTKTNSRNTLNKNKSGKMLMIRENKHEKNKFVRVIRSNRKTMSLEITPQGEVLVRAPYSMPQSKIEQFVKEKEDWIWKHLTKIEKKRADNSQTEPLSDEELQKLGNLALKVLPERVKLYAAQMGVTYGRITIRCQKTRWGSCSSKGNLNFNCLLMLAPEEVQNYVVVHELCHRLEMNHSKRFWAQVEKVMPDYKIHQRWLKENGGKLMERRSPQ